MSSIASGIGDIVQGVLNIPSAIIEGIANIFITLWDWLGNIVDGILGLPSLILDGIKDIFIPDTQSIEEQFNSTMSNLKGRLGITIYNLDNLFDKSAKPTDVKGDYNIPGVGTLNLTFAKYDYLAQGVDVFRPYIRGLIVLLLFFFNVRQLMSMFGLDTGEMTHWVNNSRGRES